MAANPLGCRIPPPSAISDPCGRPAATSRIRLGRSAGPRAGYQMLGAPGQSFSVVRSDSFPTVVISRVPRSFHLDFHAHPRMDAALKKMFTLRQTGDLGVAALKDSGPGHRDVRKATGTFGNHG